jgi:flavin reductase (DIM6/NTAB) family NADH-FMN oxidoreductase RutF
MTPETIATAPTALSVADQLKLGLRRLGKAVVVITTRHDDRRWAMVATAISELSMEPPSLLACVNRNASLYEPLTAGADFCINILHHDQLGTALACSSAKGEDRFLTGDWAADERGTPYLRGAQACFFCTHAAQFEHGTHVVVIGNVQRVDIDREADPLIYLDGSYSRAVRLADAQR